MSPIDMLRSPNSRDTTREMNPAYVTQAIFSSVWILASKKVAMVATATKTAVQVPCSEMELRAIEMESRPDPAMIVISASGRRVT